MLCSRQDSTWPHLQSRKANTCGSDDRHLLPLELTSQMLCAQIIYVHQPASRRVSCFPGITFCHSKACGCGREASFRHPVGFAGCMVDLKSCQRANIGHDHLLRWVGLLFAFGPLTSPRCYYDGNVYEYTQCRRI
ncbi:hypothetical protein BDV24DRAFT_67544 [Aspergillus arachidicola]|uniref:Uncharacterized protein n=1 Tax=Aspergillus arachidicola TaxID=656916 RepID=A0A5N6YPF2_9EURO|nr:hypothetical protein BDV24DRAFT_67544 [Aspergillus arachidicola]